MFVYKSCHNFIVTLEINEDTLTNLSRSVINDQYAEYRCDKAKVIKIENKDTGEEINRVGSNWDSFFVYIVGKIVVSEFDPNIDIVHSTGIHFYKSRDAAYRHEKHIYNGEIKKYHDNGQLMLHSYSINDKLNGKWVVYERNGKIQIKGNYINDKRVGDWVFYNEDGHIFLKEIYVNGELKSRFKYRPFT